MLQITEHTKADSVTLLLTGRFDFQARKLFLTTFKQTQATNPKKIVLDFGNVPFMDSSGLGLLMLVKKDLGPQCQLSLVVPQGYVKDVLLLANMDQQFSMVESAK